MSGFLHNLSGVIPSNDKVIEIALNGKNLIVTGPNGCGKTVFLSSLYEKVAKLIIKRGLADLNANEASLKQALDVSHAHPKGSSNYLSRQNYIKSLQQSIDSLKQGVIAEINEPALFLELFETKKAIIKFFSANRVAKITHADTAKGVFTDKSAQQNEAADRQAEKNLGSNLEQHLVNLKNRSSLAITEEKDVKAAEKIKMWFVAFENSLKKLLEDDSAKLQFDANSLKFSISQSGKRPFTFQNLSSGYTAIFDIYADLLMRTEYFDVTPSELRGIAIIDELDAHLHVSLQRLILPFFEEAFPKIQFIVSTHSPFILMSAKNAVVYDMGTNKASDVDLSFYSYSAVMEALLATKPISVRLQKTISEIAELSATDAPAENPGKLEKLKSLVEELDANKEKLNSENRAFLEMGKRAILDTEDKSV